MPDAPRTASSASRASPFVEPSRHAMLPGRRKQHEPFNCLTASDSLSGSPLARSSRKQSKA